jgi:hypothetical protein
MTKKKLTPEEAIDGIQEARDILWDLQRESVELDIEPIVLKLDKLLVAEQDKWKQKEQS